MLLYSIAALMESLLANWCTATVHSIMTDESYVELNSHTLSSGKPLGS